VGNSGSRGDTGGPPADDFDLFQAEMETVKPLPDRQRVRPPKEAAVRRSGGPPQASTLDIRRDGPVVEGRAPGVSEDQMRNLRLGSQPPEAQLDLHGMRAKTAKSAVVQFLSNAVSSGLRLVLIIHGRGLHSGDVGPVLREVVVDCLTSSTISSRIRGFCPAAKSHGGEGAMYIALTKS